MCQSCDRHATGKCARDGWPIGGSHADAIGGVTNVLLAKTTTPNTIFSRFTQTYWVFRHFLFFLPRFYLTTKTPYPATQEDMRPGLSPEHAAPDDEVGRSCRVHEPIIPHHGYVIRLSLQSFVLSNSFILQFSLSNILGGHQHCSRAPCAWGLCVHHNRETIPLHPALHSYVCKAGLTSMISSASCSNQRGRPLSLP